MCILNIGNGGRDGETGTLRDGNCVYSDMGNGGNLCVVVVATGASAWQSINVDDNRSIV